MKDKVLITGSSGFIGMHLNDLLKSKSELFVLKVSRRKLKDDDTKELEISSSTDWSNLLKGVDTVIHLAGTAHKLATKEEYKENNLDSTLNLVNQATKANVRRFIFLSSIKVNGEHTSSYTSFKPNDKPNPQDAYAEIKLDIENALIKFSKETNLEVVIVRPVLVYGPGVKSNLLNLMKWIKKGLPLPLGNIKNKRDFVSVTNLTDFIYTCIKHPKAKNETFIVSDQEAISISELIKMLSMGLVSRNPFFIPFPKKLLRYLLLLIGKKGLVNRLLDSLEVDTQKNKEILEWEPIETLEQGLKRMSESFLKD
tara:strand:+ start:4094 stop:5026 length:933 start_codon:yes stop_codon:yes gene_type:complete